jgi:hypothetical protein
MTADTNASHFLPNVPLASASASVTGSTISAASGRTISIRHQNETSFYKILLKNPTAECLKSQLLGHKVVEQAVSQLFLVESLSPFVKYFMTDLFISQMSVEEKYFYITVEPGNKLHGKGCKSNISPYASSSSMHILISRWRMHCHPVPDSAVTSETNLLS